MPRTIRWPLLSGRFFSEFGAVRACANSFFAISDNANLRTARKPDNTTQKRPTCLRRLHESGNRQLISMPCIMTSRDESRQIDGQLTRVGTSTGFV